MSGNAASFAPYVRLHHDSKLMVRLSTRLYRLFPQTIRRTPDLQQQQPLRTQAALVFGSPQHLAHGQKHLTSLEGSPLLITRKPVV